MASPTARLQSTRCPRNQGRYTESEPVVDVRLVADEANGVAEPEQRPSHCLDVRPERNHVGPVADRLESGRVQGGLRKDEPADRRLRAVTVQFHHSPLSMPIAAGVVRSDRRTAVVDGVVRHRIGLPARGVSGLGATTFESFQVLIDGKELEIGPGSEEAEHLHAAVVDLELVTLIK